MRGIFDLPVLKKRIQELEAQSLSPTFWEDKNASSILKEKKQTEDKVISFESLTDEYKNTEELNSFQDENLHQELLKNSNEILKKSNQLKMQLRMSSVEDYNNCFIEINAGAGGTEACDWANMLKRMYVRFAQRSGFKCEEIDELSGDPAGIKSATLKISGPYAFGWLKNESGVHRLVRISPFDSSGKRHTSFASIWTYPEVDDSINIVIDEKDLKIDTYRSSGAGGQHVNKTDSAVRMTHLPSGIVVQCQNERSQIKNRDFCMKMLKSKLYESELRKQKDELDKKNATKNKIEWGSQIRSYVLQPYKKVKDLRTNIESSDADGVLDGDLEIFLNV